MSHKLAPRSSVCVFLGFSPHHKGYRCIDLATQHVLISRHVVFDESTFPFYSMQPPFAATYEFLTILSQLVLFSCGQVGGAGGLGELLAETSQFRPGEEVER
jgi:hypothetical protein